MFNTYPLLNLEFSEPVITFSQISDHTDKETKATDKYIEYWEQAKQGMPVGKFETVRKERYNFPSYTLIATQPNFHPDYKRWLNKRETCLAGSFPLDYNFLDQKYYYIIGMSVPPVMIAQIATRIKEQWLDPLKERT